jgi:hypothetical protein
MSSIDSSKYGTIKRNECFIYFGSDTKGISSVSNTGIGLSGRLVFVSDGKEYLTKLTLKCVDLSRSTNKMPTSLAP